MSKYIAGSSNKRLWGEDINEDYFIHNSKMAVVCDGMGGGGINVPRSHLENLVISEDQKWHQFLHRRILQKMSEGDIPASLMVSIGLAEIVRAYQPKTKEDMVQAVAQTIDVVQDLTNYEGRPKTMDNVGSTIVYMDLEDQRVMSVGDSMALRFYLDGNGDVQFDYNRLNNYVMETILADDFAEDRPGVWESLRDHPHSNIVTGSVCLDYKEQMSGTRVGGLLTEKPRHGGILSIEPSGSMCFDRRGESINVREFDKVIGSSLTLLMSDGISPDFLTPPQLASIVKESLITGVESKEDLEGLIQKIQGEVENCALERVNDWKQRRDLAKSQNEQFNEYRPKSDDATIVAIWHDPFEEETSEIGEQVVRVMAEEVSDDEIPEFYLPPPEIPPAFDSDDPRLWDDESFLGFNDQEEEFLRSDVDPSQNVYLNSDPFYYAVGDHLTSMFDSIGKKYESVCISLRDSYASFEAGVREKLGSARVKVESAKENYSGWKQNRAVEKEARESDRLAAERDRLQQERHAADEKYRETAKSREEFRHRQKEKESAREDLREARRVLWGERKDYVKDIVTSPMVKRGAVTTLGLAALIGAGTIVYHNKDALTQMYHDATYEETVFDRAEQAILAKDCDNLNLVYQDLKNRSTNGENGIFSTQYDVRRTMAEIDCELELKETKNE